MLDDGPLGLDAGDRRRAVAAGRGASRRARPSSREVPAKVRVGGVVFDHRTEVDPGPDDRPRRAAPGAARRDEAERRHRDGRRDRGVARACSSASGAPGAKRPPGRDRAALRRRVDERPRPAGRRRRGARRPACRSTRSRSARPQGTLPDGKPVPPDTASLRQIAERSGGAAFTAQDADGLSAVYERLGSQVAMKERAARDHRRVRRRRDRPAARRRRAVAALVPAPDLTCLGELEGAPLDWSHARPPAPPRGVRRRARHRPRPVRVRGPRRLGDGHVAAARREHAGAADVRRRAPAAAAGDCPGHHRDGDRAV